MFRRGWFREKKFAFCRKLSILWKSADIWKSEFPKRVPKASSRSKFPKQVPEASSQSEFPKQVPKVSSQSKFPKRFPGSSFSEKMLVDKKGWNDTLFRGKLSRRYIGVSISQSQNAIQYNVCLQHNYFSGSGAPCPWVGKAKIHSLSDLSFRS
jgi:hypothetical protein